MAARSFVQLLGAADPGVVILGFSFFPQGTGAISSSQIVGRGVQSVAWSTNRYVVTLADVYPTLLSATATLQLGTAADRFCQIGAVNLANRTIEIVVWDVSDNAPASVAANAANEINVCLVLKNSQV